MRSTRDLLNVDETDTARQCGIERCNGRGHGRIQTSNHGGESWNGGGSKSRDPSGHSTETAISMHGRSMETLGGHSHESCAEPVTEIIICRVNSG